MYRDDSVFPPQICRIKIPYPFQWGGPTFDAGEAFAMMAASFASLIEVVCCIMFLSLIIYEHIL